VISDVFRKHGAPQARWHRCHQGALAAANIASKALRCHMAGGEME
jgi:hypothetical protein